jgi:DNA ligase (NAD+)
MIQEKLDGLSISLLYEDGKFIQMLTRGDGKQGEDITENAMRMPSIPQTIPEKGTVLVRGEAVISWVNFRENFKGEGENPRNTATGVIRSKSLPDKLKYVDFVAYDYYGANRRASVKTEEEVLKYLSSMSFKVPVFQRLVNSPTEMIAVYESYDKGERDNLPYMTDGLVAKVNSLDSQERLGVKNNRPEYAIAMKPTPKACVTRIIGITWEMGLSGRYTPVIQVEPTPLDGVTLRNVSMHNLRYLKEWTTKGLKLGSTITVVRSGDVIPMLKSLVNP